MSEPIQPDPVTPSRSTTARPGHLSMLVVHCDSLQLKKDQLHLGSEVSIARSAAKLLSNFEAVVTVIDGTNRDSLIVDLAGLGDRQFDVVYMVGHSNATGLRIASDPDVGFIGWDELCDYLRPFKPRRLVLAACQAGRFPAAKALFDGVGSLQQIVASPVNASKNHARLLLSVATITMDAPIPVELLRICQGIGTVLGGQLRYWGREDMNDPSGQLFDLASDLLQPGVRYIADVLTGLLKDK
mgnify:CR=1 FL=1